VLRADEARNNVVYDFVNLHLSGLDAFPVC